MLEIAEHLGIDYEAVRRHIRIRGYTVASGQRSMENHPMWTGGAVKDKHGYLFLRVAVDSEYGYLIRAPQPGRKNGYAAAHRMMMHDKLGRKLERGEVVHHIDGDKLNNHPSNLGLFASNADHLRETLKGCVPKWTPEGFARMCAQRSHYRGKMTARLANSTHPKSDDPPSP